MAINFPGPYEIRLFYTCSSGNVIIEHQARYNLDLSATPTPGDAFSVLSAVTRDAVNVPLDDAIDAWIVLIKGAFNSTTTFIRAELWAYEPNSFDASFISVYDIAVAGTSGTATVAAQQSMLTFRTLEGGVLKLNFMESITPGQAIDAPPYTPSQWEDVRAFVLSGSNWILGRDTSYPFAAIAHYPGTNEALFKKRFRST
jgi:hypothetical protein